MMARIDKSLLKLWVWFIACIIAYNPEPLAGESPDIDVAMTMECRSDSRQDYGTDYGCYWNGA